ncbi:MAG: hypothetical protein L3J66_08545 [Bacteroidales bacterium]|nr:hypothetical protein [Bacteroidales bacterium]
MLITLDIDLSNKNAQAFIKFVETIDFIQVKEKEHLEEYVLTKNQKNVLEERKQRHISKKSKSFTWEEIQEELRASSDE